MSDLLTDRYLLRRDWLAARMRRDFPAATHADVEEALQDMWVDLRMRAAPLPTEPGCLDGLMRCVAWRRLRGRFRRRSSRLEQHTFEEVGHVPPGQELLAERWRWSARFAEVTAVWGGPDPDALGRALLDKLHAREPDTVVAARHGLTRERLNGAWNALVDAMLPRSRRRARR